MGLRINWLSLSLLSLLSTGLHAAYVWQPSPPPHEIEAKLSRVQGDSGAHKAAIAAGKRAAFFCANCHGETGVSSLQHVPNLAGQNAFYLLNQIDKFGDGRRKDDFMSGLVKVLKPDDRFNIAVFYASQSVPHAAERSCAGAQRWQAFFSCLYRMPWPQGLWHTRGGTSGRAT
jgi:cytochrome c553